MHDGPVDAVAKECAGCALGRRRFIVGAARTAAVLLGLGSTPRIASALLLPRDGLASDERRYAIPAGDGVAFDDGAQVILARRGAAVYAFSPHCPHKRTKLRWQARNDRFECPKHKSRYRPDGVFISGRATRSMDRYAIRRDGEAIVVDLAVLLREDRDGPAWRSAVVQL